MEERDDRLMYVIWAKHLGYATHIHKFLFWDCLDSEQASHFTVVLTSTKDSVTICSIKQSQYLPSLNFQSSLPCRWELIITAPCLNCIQQKAEPSSWTVVFNVPDLDNWTEVNSSNTTGGFAGRKSSAILISFIYCRTCYLLSLIGTEIS